MRVAHKIVLMPALAVAALILVFAVVQVTRSANESLDRRIETGYLPAVIMGQELDRLLAELQIDGRSQAKLDASDMVQEVFLDAHRDFADFRGTTERDLMAWLRQILAHTLVDHVHRRYRTQSRDVRLERSVHDELDRSSCVLDRGPLCANMTETNTSSFITVEGEEVITDGSDSGWE